MNTRRTLVTAGRVLAQLRSDHRTIVLMLVVPCVLLGLLAWIFQETPVFDLIGAALLGMLGRVAAAKWLAERERGTRP